MQRFCYCDRALFIFLFSLANSQSAKKLVKQVLDRFVVGWAVIQDAWFTMLVEQRLFTFRRSDLRRIFAGAVQGGCSFS